MSMYDVIIIGAGAAGLSAAAVSTSRGKNTAVFDMGAPIARKVSVSGGGRCNFTNDDVSYKRYFGNNTNFVRSAISQIPPSMILSWVQEHGIKFEEKASGQYFCCGGASEIVRALIDDAKNATIFTNTPVNVVSKKGDYFCVETNAGVFNAKSIIIATGGIAFPTLKVSDFGYRIAKQFGHKIIPVRPALCAIATKYFPSTLAGISTAVEITINKEIISDSMLFTHFGIGGPAVYRATVRDFTTIQINLIPNIDVYELLRSSKKTSGNKTISNILSKYIPSKLAKWLCADQKNVADYKDSELRKLADNINRIEIKKEDISLHSMQSAEVVRGGVDTSYISSKTMESSLCRGLFFAGEVLDITGDLGGFNLHWAWASGRVAGANA